MTVPGTAVPYANPNAAYTRVLGGHACMMVGRNTYAPASIAASSATLANQATSNGNRPALLRRASGRSAAGGLRNGLAAGGAGSAGGIGAGSGATATGGSGTAAATGTHSLPHRAHRTTRPGGTGAGKPYSAEQDGQVMFTPPFCGTSHALATPRSSK